MSAALEAETEELLQFIYLMPVGVIKFRTDGGIEMLNPMASQLLLPLIAEPKLENIYETLAILCPELRTKVEAFNGRSGTILDQRNMEGVGGRQTVTLALTVTRINAKTHMATLRDVTRLTDMLAFAFTSADLLIDVDADGDIAWAGGAFQPLLGTRSNDVIGKPLEDLIAPRDRLSLRKALMGTGNRGRLAPRTLRLANKAETRCVLAGLAMEGARRRCFITIGSLPVSQAKLDSGMKPSRDFGVEAESWLRCGQGGVLGLLDVKNWDQTATSLNSVQLGSLKREIGRLAETAGGEAVVMGEISEGRFGVLGGAETDIIQISGALQALMTSFVPGQDTKVEGVRVSLDAGELSPHQSVHALRMLLDRFTRSGAAASGLEGGLAGVIEQANTHKRALAGMIEGGRFTMVYQPVVRLADRAVHHYEALIRPLPDAENPTANPQEFVTLVEAVGLSVELDLAVLRRAIGALRQGKDCIAVNVSGLSIADPRFEERVLAKIAGIGPGRLLIELTETAEIEDLASVALRIERMRAAGVPICLDDFGAGSASFRYLRDLRVDYVKIDGAYVRAAADSDQSRAFVTAMQDLASATGARTIAEMIETEAEARLMQELGVTYGQGWLFGKPGALQPAAPSAAPSAAPAAVPSAVPMAVGAAPRAAPPPHAPVKLERWKY